MQKMPSLKNQGSDFLTLLAKSGLGAVSPKTIRGKIKEMEKITDKLYKFEERVWNSI